MRIVFEIAGDRQLNREILRVGGRATDLRPAFESVSALWIDETKQQFETEGKHASGGWRPIKTETLDAKLRKGLDPRILHATGKLRRSLTQLGDGNMILRIERDSISYGSRLPYAEAHQNPRPGSRLPQRRPVEFTEAARRATIKLIQRFLVTGQAA